MNILNIVGIEDNDDESNSSSLIDSCETETCKTCNRNLPLTEFYSYNVERKLSTGTKIYNYKQYKSCKSCISKYNNSPEGKDKHFRKKYNISFDEYQEMNERQNYKCWICECDVSDRRNKVKSSLEKDADVYFSVDHNHKTRKVRGLLCSKCNTALGQFEDNPKWLQKAIEYLENDDEDFVVFHEPTLLADGKVEFLGTEGEKFYSLLVKLAKRENMSVDDYFWDMIKGGVESSKTDPNFVSRLKLDKKITMDEIMKELKE